MSWLRKVLDSLVPSTASMKFDPSPHIRHVVMSSGLTKRRREDVDFYVEAHEARRLNPRDVRRFGTLLTDEERAALGIKGRAILAREFVETLNDRGLADPEAAARAIAQPAAQRCRSALSLQKMREAGVGRACLRACPDPCPHAAKLDGARMPIDNAKLLPLDDCDRTGQCECFYEPAHAHSDDMDDVLI